ncbi:hypothetical protein ABTY98_36605 [Streptomyces sp. NPDC096040]|uniref:hypothetical protein n=1 Tax=Streptomyces sp. NPDC096040 TaxID=3155541 RepID=UPI003329BFD4
MQKLTKRIAVAASSVVVAGVAVLGAGGTASAATPASAHVQRPVVSVKAGDYRWDHGVGYLLEQGYCWDAVRGWHQDDRATESALRDRDGRCYRSDGEGRGWTSDSSYRHDWNRYEHDGQDRHDWNRYEHDGQNWHHHDRDHAGL